MRDRLSQTAHPTGEEAIGARAFCTGTLKPAEVPLCREVPWRRTHRICGMRKRVVGARPHDLCRSRVFGPLRVPMRRITFVATTSLPASAEAVFDWHEAPGALERKRLFAFRHAVTRQAFERQPGRPAID